MKNKNGFFFRFLILLTAVLFVLSGCNGLQQERKLREEGIALLNSGSYSEATEKFAAALKIKEGKKQGDLEKDIRSYLAEAEYRAGDYASADRTYAELIGQNGNQPAWLYLRMVCIVRGKGSADDALSCYNTAEEAADTEKKSSGTEALRMNALYALGSYLTGSGKDDRTDTALSLYEKAAENETRQNAELFNRIGMIYFGRKNYDKALPDFEKGISLLPSGGSGTDQNGGSEKTAAALYFNEASCYEYLGQYKKALEKFEAYEEKYGPDEKAQHEIVFLKTR
jgi:tetratricopeptide (TPR) repeat protein